MRVEGASWRVWVSGFGFRVSGFGFRVCGCSRTVEASGLGFGFGCQVVDVRLRVHECSRRVWLVCRHLASWSLIPHLGTLRCRTPHAWRAGAHACIHTLSTTLVSAVDDHKQCDHGDHDGDHHDHHDSR